MARRTRPIETSSELFAGEAGFPDFSHEEMLIARGARLVAFAASIGHVSDIGGTKDVLGVREIYDEGLQIPPLRLYRAGGANEDVIRLIAGNVREPDQVLGDLHALIAAKVQDPTGRWLSLDARFLMYQQRTIGWIYDAALRAELTGRLGVARASAFEPALEGVDQRHVGVRPRWRHRAGGCRGNRVRRPMAAGPAPARSGPRRPAGSGAAPASRAVPTGRGPA